MGVDAVSSDLGPGADTGMGNAANKSTKGTRVPNLLKTLIVPELASGLNMSLQS